MRHRVAAGIGFGPARIAHQIGLEHRQPIAGFAPARTQSRLALALVADSGVDTVPPGQQLVDYLAADIARAPGYQYCHCHLSAPRIIW